MDISWRNDLPLITNGKCRGCEKCDGHACAGEIPGMGGYQTGLTFQNNYFSWENFIVDIDTDSIPRIGVAPMTGTDENMGDFIPEPEFHRQIVKSATNAGCFSCIGDGTPDYKLQSGAQALRDNKTKGYAFMKPYPNEMLFERYEWVKDTVYAAGIDIDSYKIATMAGKVRLERKQSKDLIQLKKHIKHPFVVKGVAHWEDVEMIKEVKPDIIVISNHGGRVQDNGEGTAMILARWGKELKKYSGEIWVDGGIRTRNHLLKAATLGADAVLIGRPFIQGVAAFGETGVEKVLKGHYS